MSYHVKRSPSQAKRFSKCVGALALCEALPDWCRGNSSDAARLGTAAHGVVEFCLKTHIEPEALRGRIVELVGEEEEARILKKGAAIPKRSQVWYIIDDEIIEPTTVMVEYVNRRVAKLKANGVAFELELETRTNPLPERDDTSGTADVTLSALDFSFLEVVDYKNGWLLVEHVDNDQLRAYLLGKAIESDFKHKRYLITIVQPNASHDEGEVRTFEMSKAELKAFQVEYRETIRKNEVAENDKRAPTKETLADGVNPGWAKKYLSALPDAEHCTFCDAAGSGKCPARISLASEQAKQDFSDDAPDELDPPENAEAAAHLLQWQKPMMRLFAQCADFVEKALINGYTATGFKLVRGRSIRKRRDDIDEAAWVDGVVSDFNVPAKVLYKRELLSGPQIEKLIPTKRRKEYEAKYLTKPDGKLSLAREDDPREGVPHTAADDFEDDFDFDDDDNEFG